MNSIENCKVELIAEDQAQAKVKIQRGVFEWNYL